MSKDYTKVTIELLEDGIKITTRSKSKDGDLSFNLAVALSTPSLHCLSTIARTIEYLHEWGQLEIDLNNSFHVTLLDSVLAYCEQADNIAQKHQGG